MDLRDWLILIGILVIIGVLADGYRRMRLARKRSSELNFGLEDVNGGEDEFSSELPNGGARSLACREVTRERMEPGFSADDGVDENYESRAYESRAAKPAPVKAAPTTTQNASSARVERSEFKASSDNSGYLSTVEIDEPVPPVLMNLDVSSKNISGSENVSNRDSISADDSLRAQKADGETLQKDRVSEGPAHPQTELKLETSKPEKLKDRPAASDVIVINVLSRGGVFFSGEQLMQAMLSSGMRYGDMSIFHRYSNSDGTGKILFSMANGVKPGTFDINNLEATETPALSMFMSLPGPEKPMQAFALMEETARRLALDLGGELKDEQFSVMTQQTLEHCRQRIREYERKRLATQPSH
ncbi:cell division protein ZipA [uncultured Endozoicomonas sp.]|uniref:cell division protein ZipA n=1 Tax=uncultured Endozoicomonas sp. TaxID=432652 RepID=UPI002633F2FB|nr:cell division protein ZipA [uncultured Endozoicomonas sp.]